MNEKFKKSDRENNMIKLTSSMQKRAKFINFMQVFVIKCGEMSLWNWPNSRHFVQIGFQLLIIYFHFIIIN